MEIISGALLLLVSMIGGALNAVAGGGTFLTFPALLWTGMPPIAANATNTLALWPASVASCYAYRGELASSSSILPRFLIISATGGLAGALLLLFTPERAFTALIPWLLLIATLLFGYGRRMVALLHRLLRRPEAGSSDAVPLPGRKSAMLQFIIALYGGYFGAGIGILMLAMLELAGMRSMHRMNAVKALLAAMINGIAILTFSAAGAIRWPEALVMVVGSVIGGYGGARLSLNVSQHTIRRIVLAVGFGMSGWFFLRGA